MMTTDMDEKGARKKTRKRRAGQAASADSVPWSIRMSVDTLERVKKLAEQLPELPAYTGWPRMSTVAVMRLAIGYGLGVLEAQVKDGRRKGA